MPPRVDVFVTTTLGTKEPTQGLAKMVELSSGLSASRQLCFAELEFVVQLEFVVVRGSRRVENVSVQSSSVSSI